MTAAHQETVRLVCRAIAGDVSATEQLLSRYRPQLTKMIAIRIDPRLKSRFDPSDIVQSVLCAFPLVATQS